MKRPITQSDVINTNWWFHPPEKYESLIGSSSQLLGKMKNSCSKPPTRSTITTITRKKTNQTSSSATLPIVGGPTAVSFFAISAAVATTNTHENRGKSSC